MLEQVVITYDGLPVSSGASHRVRSEDKLGSWGRAKKFIESVAKIEDQSFRLELYLGCKEAKKLIPKLRWKFGFFPKKDHVSADENFYTWHLSAEKAEEAAKLLSEIEPFPAHWTGPIRLVFDARFYLVEPATRKVLPNQKTDYHFDDGYGHKTSLSNCRLCIAKKVTLSLWLVFPFSEPTADFEKYVSAVCEAAPFPLSDKHWKQWRYSKAGKLLGSKLSVRLTRRSTRTRATTARAG